MTSMTLQIPIGAMLWTNVTSQLQYLDQNAEKVWLTNQLRRIKFSIKAATNHHS